MAEIVNDSLPWSTQDEQNWNSFLQSETGKRILPKVAELAPPLLHRGHVNAILIRSGVVVGIQEAIKLLLSLSHAQPLPPRYENAYPAPEDDTAWQDGEKLEDPKSKA